ncbi:MAG TPA: LytTR family DNA-binding domain-containing protein [Flavobacteriales bacterium]|nr:LytTR family DNA-binding domain-containing protein [Flavobacteriales bacterium]HMR26138.1 LytTR family DNA-binding domain-containing protein [Flavobacteriales bacterium]
MRADAVFVRDGSQHVRLPVSDILFIEADDNSTHEHTSQRRYTVPRMLKDVLDELPPGRVERIHRSYAVNLDRVKAVSDKGMHVGDRWLPIGRSFRDEVRKRLWLL